jgi:Cu/Ag efflux protein CusF
MRLLTIILASATAATALTSAALAEQAMQGVVTQINRLNNTIAIQQTQSGTVGANTGGMGQEFKVQEGQQLDTFHAGDRVSFSVTDNSGTKTITKLERQK